MAIGRSFAPHGRENNFDHIGENDMAIVNSVATAGPGYGSGFLVSRTAIAVSSGSASAVPSSGSLTIPIYRGKIRVKIYNGAGTSPTLTKVQISITDGTNTVIVEDRNFGTAVTLSSTNYYDGVFNCVCA